MPHKSKKGNGTFLFSMALGAALAAATGYYVQHKEEVDKEAKKQLDVLAKRFKQTRQEVEKRVQDVWGDVSEEGIHRYMDLRGALLEALQEESVQRTGVIIKKNYDATVKKILDTATKAGVLTKENEQKLKDVFTMDWDDIQKALSLGAKAVRTLAKNAPGSLSKKARTIKKKTRAIKRDILKKAESSSKKAAKNVKKTAKKIASKAKNISKKSMGKK